MSETAQLALAGFLLLGSCTLIGLKLSEPLDVKLGDFGTPAVSVISMAISWGMILLAERLVPKGRFSEFMTNLALPAMAIVLGHPIFMWLDSPIIVFLLGVLMPGVAGHLALRTPAATWVTGQPRLLTTAEVDGGSTDD